MQDESLKRSSGVSYFKGGGGGVGVRHYVLRGSMQNCQVYFLCEDDRTQRS